MSLAPSLDRYVTLPDLRVGEINRPTRVRAQAGGKGFNAARTARALGAEVSVLSVIGGDTGRTVRSQAEQDGFRSAWIETLAETRQCTCLLDEHTHEMTEIYEPVPELPAEHWDPLQAAFDALLTSAHPDTIVLLSGRIPPGWPADAFAGLTGAARARGLRVLVDSDGPTVASTLAASPAVVKVNEHEARSAAGKPARDGILTVAAELIARGARSAIVTLGPAGSLVLDTAARGYLVEGPAIRDALAVGSGDAYLAGLAVALGHGMALPEAAAAGTAAARANARHFEAGRITQTEAEAERGTVRIRPWSCREATPNDA